MNSNAILLLLAGLGQVAAPPPGDLVIEQASISPQREIRVSAATEGQIMELLVREGSRIPAGALVAKIDDRRAKAAVDVHRLQYEAALERSNDDVEKRYAQAAHGVAKKDYEASRAANLTSGTNAVTQIELEKKKLDVERARLQIEKAEKDQLLAGKDAAAKKAEEEAAEVHLSQHELYSEYAGEVQQIYVRDSEWVNPGEPIFRLVQFDVMHVDCLVSAAEYDPSELEGRRVTVTVDLARGKKATVQGRVIWASQVVIEGLGERVGERVGEEVSGGLGDMYAGGYQVRAEVPNQRVGDFWLIRPGLRARMTIHTSEPPIEPAAQSASLGAP